MKENTVVPNTLSLLWEIDGSVSAWPELGAEQGSSMVVAICCGHLLLPGSALSGHRGRICRGPTLILDMLGPFWEHWTELMQGSEIQQVGRPSAKDGSSC